MCWYHKNLCDCAILVIIILPITIIKDLLWVSILESLPTADCEVQHKCVNFFSCYVSHESLYLLRIFYGRKKRFLCFKAH